MLCASFFCFIISLHLLSIAHHQNSLAYVCRGLPPSIYILFFICANHINITLIVYFTRVTFMRFSTFPANFYTVLFIVLFHINRLFSILISSSLFNSTVYSSFSIFSCLNLSRMNFSANFPSSQSSNLYLYLSISALVSLSSFF